MKQILKFSELEAKRVTLSGGKGSSLAHLTQRGIPVPPGFIISSRVYDSLVDNQVISKLMSELNVEDFEKINKTSARLQSYILSLRIPPIIKNEIFQIHDRENLTLTAVRSSATSEDTESASWAGELKTFLNTPKDKLLEKIKECWTSLFSPRALTYRLEKKFKSDKILVAVVIQEMVQSEVSGVCFTVHPITNRKSHMLIESIYGLGEALVSGETTPDSYLYDKDYAVVLKVETKKQTKKMVLSKDFRKTVWEKLPKNIQNLQKLKYNQIVELANLCKKVESYYKFPQDIEWAFWGNSFFIIQSRPITTL